MAAPNRRPVPTFAPIDRTVPIARPRLPTSAAIAPYLDRIDAALRKAGVQDGRAQPGELFF